ncbi:zonular occludens toxin domain-containing protein [Paracidovorax citrulli]|uniref:Zonular occludens toxin n=2 Tax=Paracidovorax citrulli TaxID=80869 RepID=A1TPT2_PARC0|nr:zonular occludens toxin domain-containing protein [Paracidovorax citrulli]ABM32970.1 Zonular occludens toxin [Paracidovorax citrulli AAC00-1]ATG93066.1 zonular occludens toxin [Paracidovorax citrulli]MVT29078.1 zonular occludens toxin [Paracidovorax citrulli]PVY67193.1 zona occludens toxin [Paracidovorax citrulli]REG68644.1 zona occludens toxin [Paracidovorax citrulli]
MINLLEGVPGSGKSYEAVAYHVIPALKSGRKVVTNLPLNLEAIRAVNPDWAELLEIRRGPQPVLGSWDAEAANRGEPAYLVGTFPDGVVPELTHKGLPAVPPPSNQRLFAGVWDFYDTWRGEGNIGPLYVIDECHVSFPREQLRKGKMTPDEVIQWFKISRHFGADVLLMTQRMRALEEDVAGLAEMHIRVRKVAFLGRPNEYVRKVFAGLRGGEVSSDIRPYKPEFFGFYKSHTQGAAVIEAAAQDVAPSTVKWRRASRIMFALSGVGFIWLGWQIFGPAPEPKKPVQQPAKLMVMQGGKLVDPTASASPAARPQAVVATAAPAGAQTVAASAPAASSLAAVVVPAGPLEPMEARGLHLAGCMTMGGKSSCVIAVSQNGQPVFTVTDADLVTMGYKFQRLADCAAVVTWRGTARSVICDLPQVGMAVAGVSRKAQAQAEQAMVRTVPVPDLRDQPSNTVTVADVVHQARTGTLPVAQ